MESPKILPILLAVFSLAAVCLAQPDQPGRELPEAQLKVRPVPDKKLSMPFPPGSETRAHATSIEFRTPEQMSEQDKLVEAGAEAAIQERTTWADMDFSEGKWNYRQVVCPALPGHMFLQFTRNNGTGDVSVFSASIPRQGDGRVRIVPIQRRGYSLFSPAPINALTISAFNHIRAEESPDTPPDWLGTALCYAALAGARPEAFFMTRDSEPQTFPAGSAPMLEIPSSGGAVIRFTDMAGTPRPMEWIMTFNGKGKLLKAAHSPATMITAKVLPQGTADLKGRPIPQGAIVAAPYVPNP